MAGWNDQVTGWLVVCVCGWVGGWVGVTIMMMMDGDDDDV